MILTFSTVATTDHGPLHLPQVNVTEEEEETVFIHSASEDPITHDKEATSNQQGIYCMTYLSQVPGSTVLP